MWFLSVGLHLFPGHALSAWSWILSLAPSTTPSFFSLCSWSREWVTWMHCISSAPLSFGCHWSSDSGDNAWELWCEERDRMFIALDSLNPIPPRKPQLLPGSSSARISSSIPAITSSPARLQTKHSLLLLVAGCHVSLMISLSQCFSILVAR